MGITLYCLRYGHIPFEQHGVLELYESIRNDDLHLENEQDANFTDLIHRLLEKDPEKRITMDEIRVSIVPALSNLLANTFSGASMGDTKWQRSIVAGRGELRESGGASH
jgi:serine/threonine protein kinase